MRVLLIVGSHQPYYNQVRNYPDIIIESEPEYLPFDEEGNLW